MSTAWWSFTRDRRPLVDLLCVLYGLSSWLAITGLWMELPLLVHALPEGWALSASLSLAIQLGNVGPLLYGLGRFFCARYCTGPRALSAANHVQLCVGLAACVVLICGWKVTTVVLGQATSLVLLVSAFALSIVDCTSSVVYLPFVGRFREVYMTSYLVGEGVGGIVPSLVALAQGLSEPECANHTDILSIEGSLNTSLLTNETTILLKVGATNFEPEVFFGVLLLLVVLSYASFFLLDNCKSLQTEWQEDFRREMTRRSLTFPVSPEAVRLDLFPYSEEHKETLAKEDTKKPAIRRDGDALFRPRQLTRRYYVTLLLIQTWCSLLTFGFLPAIQVWFKMQSIPCDCVFLFVNIFCIIIFCCISQSYSCLPYGPRALHLAVTLCGIAYPVACALAMFVVLRRMHQLCAQTLLGTLGATYITLTAATSPTPPLVDTDEGTVLVVCCWVATFLVLSYAKTMVTLVLSTYGEKALFWVGACTQLGALVGSLVPYLLISHLRLFSEREHCADA